MAALRFLLDNDLPHRLAVALTALDYERQIDALRDVYGEDAKDVDWIPRAAKDGYAVISVDRAQTKKAPEKAVLRASRVTVVYLGPFFAKRKYWGKVEWLVRHWPTIVGWIEASPKGTIGSAQENGTIRTLTIC